MEVGEVVLKALDYLSEGILITEANLEGPEHPKILFVNKAMTKLTGYTCKELLGQTPRILQGDQTESSSRKMMKKKLSKGQAVRTIVENYRKDGSTYWVELSISPVVEGGTVRFFIAVQNDVSVLKSLEDRLTAQSLSIKQHLQSMS
jgi:PAS domain S-box-containing protein